MKKEYTIPQIEIVDLINSDIICESLDVSDDENNEMLTKEGIEEDFGW